MKPNILTKKEKCSEETFVSKASKHGDIVFWEKNKKKTSKYFELNLIVTIKHY
jgi:hypothetical protein